MDEKRARQVLDDAIMVWKELEWFNRLHDNECHLFLGDSIQLVDDSEYPGIGSLAEDIADSLNMTRVYSPSGLCHIRYKGYSFYSNWRDNG